MTPEELEDDSARPKAPPIEGLTDRQLETGQRLAQIHRMYRMELLTVARLMDEIRTGIASADTLAPAVADMKLTENMALFGNICGRECQLLSNHHEIEEQWMFPALALNGSAGLRAVIDRLTDEHQVIHRLLVELDEAARQLAASPTPALFDACATAFARLDRAIRSHFGYEEVELAPALGLYEDES